MQVMQEHTTRHPIATTRMTNRERPELSSGGGLSAVVQSQSKQVPKIGPADDPDWQTPVELHLHANCDAKHTHAPTSRSLHVLHMSRV